MNSADVKPEYVVKILVLIVNHKEEYIDILYREMVKLFGNNLPASTLIPVPRLARDNLLFEIEATAIIPT
ncbi:MAG: RidA family protein [Nitrososphaeraceae archaeon]